MLKIKKLHNIHFKKSGILISLGIISAGLFLYFYVPLFVIEIKNPFIEIARTYVLKEKKLKINKEEVTPIQWKGANKVLLSGNFYPARQQPAQASIILVHGIRSQKEVWDTTARWLQQKGFNAITIDLRAHGNSQGSYCTYGYYEKEDISKLVDFLISNYKLKTPIGIWGHSLGGAISLQALAIDNRLQFGIIESAYANFEKITKDYSDYYLSFHLDPLNKFVIERAGEMACFNPEDINPETYCNQIHQPVLLLHGKNDQKINYKNALKNFEALKSENKKLILIEQGHHTDILLKGGEKIKTEILNFLKENTTRNPSLTISAFDQNSDHIYYNNLI